MVRCEHCKHQSGDLCGDPAIESTGRTSCKWRNAAHQCDGYQYGNRRPETIASAKARKLWADYVATGAAIPARLRKYDPDYDYVGPDRNRLLQAAVPNYIGGMSINMQAFWHDRGYHMGGSRAFWDNEFLRQIVAGLWYFGSGTGKFIKDTWIACHFWAAVRLFGRSSFNTGG